MNAPIERTALTGLVLCGGRGERMGGQDKGWLLLDGHPLVAHALARLAPQVGTLAISANRHLARYAALGHPVWPDDDATRYAGPLAGMAAALARMGTPWLAVAPCDMPHLPLDWVARLGAAAQTAAAPVALAALRTAQDLRPMPVVALLHQHTLAGLRAELDAGNRRVAEVLTRLGGVQVVFEEASAFVNANTASDLAGLAQGDSAQA